MRRLAGPDNHALRALPEKVLQFGTGAFIRGFADAVIDQANRAGRFGGRVVAVGSTGSGRTAALQAQDGAFTLCLHGFQGGTLVDRHQVVTSISRALSAQHHWDDVLACAANPDLVAVLSNTTEAGLALHPDDQHRGTPPRSFPAKLTAFLHARARAFNYHPDRGLVVLPLELLADNGALLQRFVHERAAGWGLGNTFRDWLDHACRFCNTLVDRIVPGTPPPPDLHRRWAALGYRDDLLITAEPYLLWAVEGDAALCQRVGFLGEAGVIVADDITPYRMRKVRILNGAHTLMAPVALLCGLTTVGEAVADPAVGRYLRRLVFTDILPGLPDGLEGAHRFADDVLERFANPFIAHPLRNLMLEATTKLAVRALPTLQAYVRKWDRLPASIVCGLAAYLLLRRAEAQETLAFTLPPDHRATLLHQHWNTVDAADPATLRRFAHAVCRDDQLWGQRIDAVPGLADRLAALLEQGRYHGAPAMLAHHLKTSTA